MIRQALNLIEKNLDSNCFSSLLSYFNWLSNSAPVFSVSGHQIRILSHPNEFYESLLEKCQKVENRILLTSLYLGNDPLSENLVRAIEGRLNEKKNLDVSILLDANRGSRGKRNSRQMLLPLVKNYPSCQVSMYHTPLLRGTLRYFLPQRYNELVGLQHMKIYLFDNTVIISGANLSEDYFTNRQDRYIMVNDCKDLADFYWNLVQKISSVSFVLDSSDSLVPRLVHPFKSPLDEYIDTAKKEICDFYNSCIGNDKEMPAEHDTLLFPLIEAPPLQMHMDSRATSKLLDSASLGCRVTLSTGYFNLTDGYRESILNNSSAQYDILMAHPTANGFNKASFPAGGIPQAYTAIAEDFSKRCKGPRILLHEYIRPGWTYHVKGLWLTPQRYPGPLFTLVGSSNFGVRSVTRDVESSLGILSWNKNLNKALRKEQEDCLSYCVEFTPETPVQRDRKPAYWVRAALFAFRSFF